MTAVKFDLNAYLLDSVNLKSEFNTPHMQERGFRQVEPIVCADGLSMSVQASQTHYCAPRDSVGPWTTVEVGFPSQRVEELMEYAETPDTPTDTVYGNVPVAVVEAVIEKHGGLKQ
jgi:hypothetical protein